MISLAGIGVVTVNNHGKLGSRTGEIKAFTQLLPTKILSKKLLQATTEM